MIHYEKKTSENQKSLVEGNGIAKELEAVEKLKVQKSKL